ncbi:MAG TPA: hypothetical protein VF555_17590 [Variovorax sp.]
MTFTAIPLDRTLDLVSDTDVGSYCFHASGSVTATIGKKDGPVCGPIFSYRVVSPQSIEIIGSDGYTDRWTNIRVESDLLHAECNGLARTFTIGKPSP